MSWLRWQSSYLVHPKTRKMRHAGRVIFWTVCQVAKIHELRGGVIPAQYADPDYLADLIDMDPDDCVTGIAQAVKVGLLERDGDGLVIRNWSRYQIDPGVADRVAAHRERKKAESVTDVTVTQECNGCNDDSTGRDSTGQDKEEESPNGDLSTSGPKVDDVRHIFDHWCSAMGKRKSAKMTSDRRTKIQARLRDGYSVADLEQAITNAAADSWTMGDNDRHKAFNDITTLFKGGASVDRYLDMAPAGPTVEEDEDPGEVRLAYFRRMMEREGIEYVAGFMDTSDPMDAWVMAQLEGER